MECFKKRRANQWPLLVCKALIPASPGEQIPGGSLQGACIHSSCHRGPGSSAMPGEATGNAGCARAQERQRKQRREREHKRRKRP